MDNSRKERSARNLDWYTRERPSTWSKTAQRLLRSMDVHSDGISEIDLTDDERASLETLRAYGLVYKNATSQTFRMTDKGRRELHRIRTYTGPTPPTLDDADATGEQSEE